MSADSFDDFPYETDTHASDAEARRHYWAVAIGLQAVDGLEVSPYLHDLARSYEQGQYTLQETGELIRAYHTGEADGRQATAEADLVSQRIAEMLEAGSFVFAPDMLSLIHRALFQDLDAETYRPGQFKTERLVKQEDILNGDSVLYADPAMIQTSLDYLFREEGRQSYGTTLSEADVARLAQFIAFLWQVHPSSRATPAPWLCSRNCTSARSASPWATSPSKSTRVTTATPWCGPTTATTRPVSCPSENRWRHFTRICC